MDSRNVSELFTVDCYTDDYSDWENLRENIRTWSDSDSGKPSAGNKQGAACDVWLTSNFGSGGAAIDMKGVATGTYPSDGSTSVWNTAPAKTYLYWRFGEANKSGGGHLIRAMATYETTDEDEEDHPGKQVIQLSFKRGMRLG